MIPGASFSTGKQHKGSSEGSGNVTGLKFKSRSRSHSRTRVRSKGRF